MSSEPTPPIEQEPRNLLEELDRLWRSDMSGKDAVNETVRRLAESPDFDLCSVASRAIRDGFDCFRAYHLLGEVVPIVSRKAETLFGLLLVFYESMKNDLLSGIQYEIIEKMAELNPRVLDELKGLLLESDKEFVISYLNSIYSKMSDPRRFHELIQLLESEDALKQRIALVSLGNCAFDQMPFENFDRAVKRLDQLMLSSTSNILAAATVFLTRQIGMGRLAEERVLKLASLKVNEVHFQLSQFLLFSASQLGGNELLESILGEIARNHSQSWGIIQNLDTILYQLLGSAANAKLAESAITEILLHIDRKKISGDFGDLLQSCATRLGDSPELSMRIVTNFFVSNNIILIGRATEIMSWNRLYRKLSHTLDHSIITTLKTNQLTIILHRMLATVFEPAELCSLTFSILDAHPGSLAVAQLVWDCLLNYIAVDYPLSTIEFINSELQSSNGASRPANYMSELLKSIKAREEIRANLPELKELQFTEIGLFKIALAEHRNMEGAKDSVKRRSSLFDLVTKVPLKYGKAWFSFRDGQYTEPSGFHQVEFSFEVPRTEVFNPVGATMQRAQFRKSGMVDDEAAH